LNTVRNSLKGCRNEVVDLEDISGGISITDLTFNDFKIELMEYMKKPTESFWMKHQMECMLLQR
jgi:hypothetical protein